MCPSVSGGRAMQAMPTMPRCQGHQNRNAMQNLHFASHRKLRISQGKRETESPAWYAWYTLTQSKVCQTLDGI